MHATTRSWSQFLEVLQEAAAVSDDSAGGPPLAPYSTDPASRLAALAKKIRDWTAAQRGDRGEETVDRSE